MGALIEINTDGLAKLGETICYGIGLAAFGRKKMANAEAYAAIKQAETETKVEFLKLKGQEEIAKYNVKSVVEKATSHFMEEEKVSNEPVNTDWTNRFFSIVEDISDETLQDIWGRILAGEVKQPNSFSLRTLDLLRNVTKEEAELFVKASKYYVEKNFICTEEFALSLHETLLLGETGFINSEELTKEWNIEPNSKLEIIIDRNTLIILHNDTNKKVWCQPSVKKLSKAGIEILSLVEKTDRNKFYKILTQFFKSNGVSRVFKHEIVEYGENCSYKSIGEELFG